MGFFIKNTHMYICYRQNLNPVLFKYPMGMFKYSSEVIPTQTLQLNTIKVCLYMFETTIWKCLVLSRKQFSLCKNNSSWYFFPFHNRMNLTSFKVLFLQNLKYFHSLLPKPVIITCTGNVQEAKRPVSAFATALYNVLATLLGLGLFCSLEISYCFLIPHKPVNTFPLTVFNLQILAAELKKYLHFVGRGWVFGGHEKG